MPPNRLRYQIGDSRQKIAGVNIHCELALKAQWDGGALELEGLGTVGLLIETVGLDAGGGVREQAGVLAVLVDEIAGDSTGLEELESLIILYSYGSTLGVRF